MGKKKPHKMNENEQRELAEHLTEVLSGIPCDFTETEMTEDERREYDATLALEAQDSAESLEEILQRYDKLPESEWPDDFYFHQGGSIRTLMQKRKAATPELRKDILAFYWSVFRKCPSCGTPLNPDEARRCDYCGSDQALAARNNDPRGAVSSTGSNPP
jgi:hypothetical protein